MIIIFQGQSQYSSVLAFRGNGAVNDWVKYGDRAPAILFKRKTGELHFTNAVSGNRNFAIDYHIELNQSYHIEIVQEEKNGKVGLSWLDLIYLALFLGFLLYQN